MGTLKCPHPRGSPQRWWCLVMTGTHLLFLGLPLHMCLLVVAYAPEDIKGVVSTCSHALLQIQSTIP
jgi:hypothetical protein